ncbi:hypothetical protein GGD40_005597 [Paraburkholderia bryophila]|uniref:Uncharacterized protein n=1 Tax=Paraburkholderia bryophila TaxID=420952 RepID=A0A7Y9WTX4_9BURK|nr:hypothetical protein [Paraburkholderia bryophila]
MHDADVAITLMNRWEQATAGPHRAASVLELLHEGGLRFMRTQGVVHESSGVTGDAREIECLAFDDGSTAIRFLRSHPNRDLTPWAAVAPLRRLQEHSDGLDS